MEMLFVKVYLHNYLISVIYVFIFNKNVTLINVNLVKTQLIIVPCVLIPQEIRRITVIVYQLITIKVKILFANPANILV